MKNLQPTLNSVFILFYVQVGFWRSYTVERTTIEPYGDHKNLFMIFVAGILNMNIIKCVGFGEDWLGMVFGLFL